MQTEHDDHISAECEPRYAESSCSDNELNENLELHMKPAHIYSCERTYYPEYVFDNDIKVGDETKAGVEQSTPSPSLEPTNRAFRQTCCKFIADKAATSHSFILWHDPFIIKTICGDVMQCKYDCEAITATIQNTYD